MDDFRIDESTRKTIEKAVRSIVADDARVHVEIQDAGSSLCISVTIMPNTTVKEVFRMYDEVDLMLSNSLPIRKNKPRWSQGYSVGGRIIYGNIGGIEISNLSF